MQISGGTEYFTQVLHLSFKLQPHATPVSATGCGLTFPGHGEARFDQLPFNFVALYYYQVH